MANIRSVNRSGIQKGHINGQSISVRIEKCFFLSRALDRTLFLTFLVAMKESETITERRQNITEQTRMAQRNSK